MSDWRVIGRHENFFYDWRNHVVNYWARAAEIRYAYWEAQNDGRLVRRHGN